MRDLIGRTLGHYRNVEKIDVGGRALSTALTKRALIGTSRYTRFPSLNILGPKSGGEKPQVIPGRSPWEG